MNRIKITSVVLMWVLPASAQATPQRLSKPETPSEAALLAVRGNDPATISKGPAPVVAPPIRFATKIDRKSVGVAVGSSLGTWLGGQVLGGLLIGAAFGGYGLWDADSAGVTITTLTIGALVAAGATIVGPSVGTFYAGNSRRAWIYTATRGGLGLVTALLPFGVMLSLFSYCEDACSDAEEKK